MTLNAPVEVYTAYRQVGQSVQRFDTEMLSLVAEITPLDSDPDFDTLKITAGSNHGMPSPGTTTLLKANSFDVDSSITTGTLSMGTPSFSVPVPAMGAAAIAAVATLLLGLRVFLRHRRAA